MCSLQPHIWQEAACNFAAYASILPCCTRRWALSARGTGLTSQLSEIPLLVMGSLGLGRSDTAVLSGLGALQLGLLPGGNAAGTWAPPKKWSPPGVPFPTYCFSPNFPNTATLMLWQTVSSQQEGQAALERNLSRNLIPGYRCWA